MDASRGSYGSGVMSRGRRFVQIACALALTLPAAAGASPTQESLLQDDDQLMYNGPKAADRAFDELASLGVDRVRLSLHWGNVAPRKKGKLADPRDPASYDPSQFDGVDHALRAARQRGISVLLTITGHAPRWAVKGKRKGRLGKVWKPRAREYAKFVEMVGRRYSGDYRDENQGRDRIPRIDTWSTWNEPNWHSSLMPQWGRVRGRKVPMSPRIFRALHRGAVKGLEASGHGGDEILIGETAPLGSDWNRRKSPVKPIVFMRELFCLRGDLRPMRGRQATRAGCDFDRRGPLKATGWAHHPYPIKEPPGSSHPDPDRAVLADSGRLARVLDAAAAAGRIPGGLPLWYTEFGWQTEPDPVRGVPLGQHARWIAEAEQLTWADPRVAVHGQFLLQDDEPRTRYPAGSSQYWGTWQSGLRHVDGSPKPALDAYRMPLVAPSRVGRGDPLRLWGLVRPAPEGGSHDVAVQWRPGAGTGWETIGNLTVDDHHGYFSYSVPEVRAGDYRVVWSPPAPPPTRPLLLFEEQQPAPPPVPSPPVSVDVG